MSKGRYGIHGGQYISETLMNELIHLEECYEHYKKDPEFNAELNKLLNEYAGRPSLLYYAGKMTKDLGGAKIYLKREDLNHTGSHKINNALGQARLLYDTVVNLFPLRINHPHKDFFRCERNCSVPHSGCPVYCVCKSWCRSIYNYLSYRLYPERS